MPRSLAMVVWCHRKARRDTAVNRTVNETEPVVLEEKRSIAMIRRADSP